jgi:hypothetical protein
MGMYVCMYACVYVCMYIYDDEVSGAESGMQGEGMVLVTDALGMYVCMHACMYACTYMMMRCLVLSQGCRVRAWFW